MLLCNCNPLTDDGPVDPPVSQPVKIVDYCSQQYSLDLDPGSCLCGKWRIISECSPAGVITELNRTMLGEDCRPITDPYTLVDCSGEIEIEWQCEFVEANFDVCPTAGVQNFTIAQLVQKAIDAGAIEFPSGALVDSTCIVSDMEVALYQCGAKLGCLAAPCIVTTNSASINVPGGCIALTPGGSRAFSAQCGSGIQPIQSIDIAGGSALAVCVRVAQWVQCVLG